MKYASNPFHELYVTETINPESFVAIFSPLLVSDTVPLFHPGNIILIGTQGSGKSMLLNLLKPEVRIAFAKAQKIFPVPENITRFLSAGINLTRSGAIDFGQRPIDPDRNDEGKRFPSYFADFLNFWIVLDLLNTIDKFTDTLGGKIAKEIGIDRSKLDSFAKKLASNQCWGGYLNGINNYLSLKEKITSKISSYRAFLNYNTDSLPEIIKTTKTSVGEPISRTVEALRLEEVIPGDVPVFVRIDQYEELSRLEDSTGERGLYVKYSEVVNKLIGTRDPRVSYRIGTRRHAWQLPPKMIGTTSVIEELRNYKVVDIDEILRRTEHRPGSFASFAGDVFKRRLEHEKYILRNSNSDYLLKVFGSGHKPQEKARIYAGKDPLKALNVEQDWPAEVKKCLLELVESDPLSAKLGEAWVRQQLVRKDPDLPSEDYFPWEDSKKRWWKKERVRLALLQIAAQKRQKMIWAGKQDIIALSGCNILVFVSICQYIWETWLRSFHPEELPVQDDFSVPSIDDQYIQDEGIQMASGYWFRKIRTDPGGDSRQRFVSCLGNFFRDRLKKDLRMSYPGENGFSLPVKYLDKEKDISRYLNDAVAFGVLIDRRHTPKNRTLGECRKWYINPILSPHFQIPVSHTKEPFYAKVSNVQEWLENAEVLVNNHKKRSRRVSPKQLNIFDCLDQDSANVEK